MNDPHRYTDNGVSGVTIDRPGFQRLMRDARKKAIDGIIVWKIDRFSRSFADAVTAIKELDDLGCGFVSIEESIDMSSPFGKAALRILLVFAELERETIRLIDTLTDPNRDKRFIDRVEKKVKENEREIAQKLAEREQIYLDMEKERKAQKLAGEKNQILQQIKNQFGKYVGIAVPNNEKRELIDRLYPDYSIIYHPAENKGQKPRIELKGLFDFYMSSDDKVRMVTKNSLMFAPGI